MRAPCVAAVLATLVLPAVAGAQALEATFVGNVGASCFAQAPGATPFTDHDTDSDFTEAGSPSASGQATCMADRQGDPGFTASSDSSAQYSGTASSAGSDVFGNALVGSITLTVQGNATSNATGDSIAVGANASGTPNVQTAFRVLPGTPVTVQVQQSGGPFAAVTIRGSGFLPASLGGGFQGVADEDFAGVEIGFSGASGANTNPPSPSTYNGTITATVTFGNKPPQGACCVGPGDCLDEEIQANCTGTFLGDQTQCSPSSCSGGGSPTPTPTATPPPSTLFSWTNPSGGPYTAAANWDPPEEPGSVSGRDDTAVFDLGGSYGVDVAGARAARFVVRNGSVDLAGGTAQVTDGSLAAPSLTIGTNGVFNLVSGIFSSVHVGIGEDQSGLAAAAVLAPGAVWNASGRVTVGRANAGLLTITAGKLASAESRIGGGPARGDAIVGGEDARWETANLGLGFGGADGTLEVRDGGTVVSGDVVIGVEDGPQSVVTLTGGIVGQPSTWAVDDLEVGAASQGLVEVLAGGHLEFEGLAIGNGLLGSGTVRVAGPSTAIGGIGSLLNVGRLETGEMVVEDGAHAEIEEVFVGGGATGTLEVRGVGTGNGLASFLKVTEEITVGVNAAGTLRVTDRAEVEIVGDLLLGGAAAIEDGTVELRTGAALTALSLVATRGTLVADGTPLGPPPHSTGALVLGPATFGSNAALDLRNGGGFNAAGNKLVIDGLAVIDGVNALGTRSELLASLGELVVGETTAGVLSIRNGGFALSDDVTIDEASDVFVFGNPTPGAVDWRIDRDLNVVEGTLQFCPGPGLVTVDRQVTIHPNGVVKGNGRVTTPVFVNNGVNSGGCSIGTLVVDGAYQQTAQGRLVLEAAGPGDVDVLQVTGPATLAGTLEVHFVDGYLPSAGDFLPFLDLQGPVTGAFQRVRVRGLDEELVLAPDVVGGVAGLRALTAAKACDGACEQCDNCVDDDGDGLVDRADPDCAAAADGGGVGSGGDATARKAVVKCGAAMAAAGAKLSALVAKSLQRCTGSVLACLQTKPGDAACLETAQATCAKATAGLAPDGSARRKARDTIVKACGAKNAGEPPAVPLATIVAATGFGFDAEVARCAALATPVLASLDDVVACIDRATVCRASALFATGVPRAAELLASGNADDTLLACLPSSAADGGASGDPKTTGKLLAKCQKTIAAVGAKLAGRLAKGYAACARAVRSCLQSAEPDACRAKVEAACRKATRTLPTVAGAADAKLLAAITKACGTLDPSLLQDAAGLGFAASGARCAALGVPALDGPAALATCLSREHACGTATLVEAATPRLRELLDGAGVGLD